MLGTFAPDETGVKAAVRFRDGHKCVDCGITQEEFSRQKNLMRFQREVESCKNWGYEPPTQPEQRQFRLHVHRLKQHAAFSFENCVTLCQKCWGRRRALRNKPA